MSLKARIRDRDDDVTEFPNGEHWAILFDELNLSANALFGNSDEWLLTYLSSDTEEGLRPHLDRMANEPQRYRIIRVLHVKETFEVRTTRKTEIVKEMKSASS